MKCKPLSISFLKVSVFLGWLTCVWTQMLHEESLPFDMEGNDRKSPQSLGFMDFMNGGDLGALIQKAQEHPEILLRLEGDICMFDQQAASCYIVNLAGEIGQTWDTRQFDVLKVQELVDTVLVPSGMHGFAASMLCAAAPAVVSMLSLRDQNLDSVQQIELILQRTRLRCSN